MADVRERNDDEPEPPPFGGSLLSAPYATPIAFGSPPPEPVTLEGEIPWELREEVPFEGVKRSEDAAQSEDAAPSEGATRSEDAAPDDDA